ncbi:MAG: L-serine ammonia-lyase, iron-sulfur-dependent, subunit alpha [Bacilli bacterium]|nr:L-serine ammonia-lyase, iron-sulfur-dependent, subunit alpha [Bacilli bacterium]
MKSLKSLYRIGPGPSSSHTIGPKLAAEDFLKHCDDVTSIEVTLYASFALTGYGHRTDLIIKNVLKDYPVKVNFDINTKVKHPNTVKFVGTTSNGFITRTYESIGGGELVCLEDDSVESKDIYPFKNFNEIKEYMSKNNISSIADFCFKFEANDIKEYLGKILETMMSSVEKGLSTEGKVQAGKKLFINRVAGKLYQDQLNAKEKDKTMLIASFAYAVSEENAAGGELVTAPTCGSAGVLPAVLYYSYLEGKSQDELIGALAAAGIVGNIFKENATIAGAVGGCQAEIGVAVCMAAAALCYLDNLSVEQIEYAAELAMEHQLGLTCDPIDGYVAIPCIERNAVGAVRAVESYTFSKWISTNRKNVMSLDDIVETMKITGDTLSTDYKETSVGGISKIKNK